MRRIPPAGINLFQLIYVLIREYREKTGEEPLNLSLGNPDGVPPQAIRALKAFPLAVNVSVDEAQVLAGWRAQAWVFGSGAFLLAGSEVYHLAD